MQTDGFLRLVDEICKREDGMPVVELTPAELTEIRDNIRAMVSELERKEDKHG